MTYKLIRHNDDGTTKDVTAGFIDGYGVKERLLEGIIFEVSITPDGTIEALLYNGDDEEYFNYYNIGIEDTCEEVLEHALEMRWIASTPDMVDDEVEIVEV